MDSKIVKATAAIDKAAEKYLEHDVFRAGVQLIPYVGGPIDTILSGRASRIQMERLEQFVLELRSRLEAVEVIRAEVNGEEFADFMLSALEKVWRARTADKRSYFADVVARQVIEAHSWDEADMAVRLVAELESIHINVLSAVISAQRTVGGTNVVALDTEPEGSVIGAFAQSLTAMLAGRYSGVALRLACAELTARGLLQDDGVGRWDAKAMTYFVPTDLAVWFIRWLTQQDENKVR
jgi:hypothetical protein